MYKNDPLAISRGLVKDDGRELVTPDQYAVQVSYFASKYGISKAEAKLYTEKHYVVSQRAVDFWELAEAQVELSKIMSKL